jgi:hypothetical protein
VQQSDERAGSSGVSQRTTGGQRPKRKIRVRGPAGGLEAGRRPLVSVIIPMFNYGHYLPQTVHSALAQDHVEPQVIIVDDASTDDSKAVARRLAAADGRVTVIGQQRNGGPAAAFNRGYAAATGEFIVRLDADDLLTPGSLARSVALFDAFPDVGLVYGHPVHFTGPPPATARQHVRSWSIWPGRDWIAERCRRGVNCITTPEAIVRGSVLQQAGPLSTDIQVATDIHLWLRIAALADVARVNGPDQALYRLHPDSLTHQPAYTPLVDLAERKHVFDDFFAGPGQHLPGAAALHRTASTQLAREALGQACRAYDRGRTTTTDITGYLNLALTACPHATTLPRWHALRRRQLLGPRLAALPPFFTATQISRRIRSQLLYQRWQRTGL